jgi:hypothetical protein
MKPGLPVPLSANRRLDVAESGVAVTHGQRRRRGEAGRGIAHLRYRIDPDEIEVGPVVGDRGDHFGADCAGAHWMTRYGGRGGVTPRGRYLDNSSITFDITIN